MEGGGGGVGEVEDAGFEVLVEIGRAGVEGERLAFGAVGREQDDLGVATFEIGTEDGDDRGGMARRGGDRFAEEQVAVGEEELGVLLGELEVADPVALLGIEAGVEDGFAEIGGAMVLCLGGDGRGTGGR